MEKLLAYHGKQEIKDKYVARMKAHIEADELVRGIGFRNGKGCAVGCTLNNYNYIEYEKQLGFPRWIAKLEDSLFEGMSLEKSKTFPLVFLEVIQPGHVLENIKKSFLIYILEQALTTFDNEKFTNIRDSILRIITLHKTTFNTELETEAAARVAARVTEAARWSAAWSADAVARAVAEAAARAAAGRAAWEAEEEWIAEEAAARGVVEATAEAAAWAADAAAGAAKSAGGSAAERADSVASAVWAAAAGEAAAAAAGEAAGKVASLAKIEAYDKYADKLIELIKQCTIESE